MGLLPPDTDAHRLDTRELRTFFNRIESANHVAGHYEVELDLPLPGRRTLLMTADKIRGASAAESGILISIKGVTEFGLNSQQLIADKKAAEHASSSKSRFLASASHELRRPPQTLIHLKAVLKQSVEDAEVLAPLAKLERTLQTMSGVLNTLLDIGQLEAGTIVPKPADFPVNDLLSALGSEQRFAGFFGVGDNRVRRNPSQPHWRGGILSGNGSC